jgi:hypothetical protein
MALHTTPPESELDNPLDEVEDFQEDPLESLLGESLSLENLLDESMGLKREADNIKAKRKALADGQVPSAEREATAKLVRSWEARREWDTQAYVIRYTVQVCECCRGQNHHFEGFFLRQKHRYNSSERWISAQRHEDKEALEKEINTEVVEVSMCLTCAVEGGFKPDWDEDDSEELAQEQSTEEQEEGEEVDG